MRQSWSCAKLFYFPIPKFLNRNNLAMLRWSFPVKKERRSRKN